MTTHPNAPSRAGGAADRAGNSDWLENLARVGLVAYGLVHLVVAWLALQLAWGGGGGETDQSGAMATLAEQPFGKPLLWILAVGLFALAAWQAAEVLRWRSGWSASGDERKKALGKTVKSVARAVLYLALGVQCVRFALGGGQSNAQQQQQRTAGVFSWPGGRFLVAVVGLVMVGIGINQVVKGITKKFLKQIDLARAPQKAERLITRLGQAGFPAKGVAIVVVGGLFVYAAATFDPGKARGLDGAMRTILSAPFGGVLLTLTALGIICFGAFLFARARYPERT
jgi:hypothetical protein